MDISVVIPFFNGEQFFEECIQSVLRQSHAAKEIVIINDSPSPESVKFLSQYENNAKIIHLDCNHGISVARNIGIANCKSDWIAFLDNDDVWVDDKLEKQVNYLKNNPSREACHTGTESFSKDRVIETYLDKPLLLDMEGALLISHVLPSSFMVKKTAIEAAGLFDPKASGSEDRELTIQLIKNGVKIGFLSEVLVRFRREGHGFFSSQWKQKFKSHMYVFIKHLGQFRKYKLVRRHLNWIFGHAGYRSTGIISFFFRGLARLFR
ncbi:MAG: glycosyltransferase [Kangiellaceae bacterium]|nr:glycosyltransferase [Kangiellaceae bacterium]